VKVKTSVLRSLKSLFKMKMKLAYSLLILAALSSGSRASSPNAIEDDKKGNLRQLESLSGMGPPPVGLTVSTPCNGNGNKFVLSESQVLGFYGMEPKCDCFDCYTGENCEIKEDIKTCHVEADSVELDIVKSVLPMEPISFSNQFRIDYQSFKEIYNTTDFTYAVSQSIKDLHTAAGNVDFEGHTLIIGMGAHQLIQAAIFGLSPDRSVTTNVYAAPPYWSKFQRMINSYQPAYNFVNNYDDATDIMSKGEHIVDLITSPSNSGNLLAADQQLIDVPSSQQIWDLVYYWPSSFADKSKIVPLSEDIMIFSLAKLAGYSGHRFGWAWVKDKEVADAMSNYLSISTQSFPAAELVYGTTVIQMILDSLGTEMDFFKKIQEELMGRCKQMRKIFTDDGDKFKIKSPCGNMYILIKCMDVAPDESCKEKYFDPIALDVNGGVEMGVTDNYIRIAIGYDQSHFDLILEKLAMI